MDWLTGGMTLLAMEIVARKRWEGWAVGSESKIQWTDHTFNPWIGCAKVAAGCQHCYAERDFDARRHVAQWGPHGTRSLTSESYWKQPLKWNREAERDGVRRRVFCASLADVFEDWDGCPTFADGSAVIRCDSCGHRGRNGGGRHGNCCERCGSGAVAMMGLDDIRRALFALIDATPWLDWLLLTKRPENIRRMWPERECGPSIDRPLNERRMRNNVWLGTSIATQADADRNVPELLKCRDLSPVLFVSAEPLIEEVDVRPWLRNGGGLHCSGCRPNRRHSDGATHQFQTIEHPGDGIDFVVIGGESGPHARPCRPEWIRSLRDQCKAATVPCFIKQLGANVVTRNDMIEDTFSDGFTGWPDPDVEYDIHGFREEFQGADCRIKLRDPKGGDTSEWPEDLRVREFPEVQHA